MIWSSYPSSSKRPDHFSGLLFNKKLGPFSGLEWPRWDVDHSLPSSGQAKNKWSYKATPSYAFLSWDRKSYLFKNLLPVTEFPYRLFHCIELNTCILSNPTSLVV